MFRAPPTPRTGSLASVPARSCSASAPATGARIHSAGIRIFGSAGGTCLIRSVGSFRLLNRLFSSASGRNESRSSPRMTLTPSAHEGTRSMGDHGSLRDGLADAGRSDESPGTGGRQSVSRSSTGPTMPGVFERSGAHEGLSTSERDFGVETPQPLARAGERRASRSPRVPTTRIPRRTGCRSAASSSR